MTDGDEAAVHANGFLFPGGGLANADPSDPGVVSEHLVEHVIPFDDDVPGPGLLDELAGKDLLGPEPVPAVDHRDRRRDVREIERLLDRGVAPADDRDRLRSVEESVAGGAGRYPAPLVRLLGVEPEIQGGGTGCDDQRVAVVRRGVAEQLERPAREIGARDVVVDDLRVEPFRVPAHPFHQVRPLHALGVTGPIVDVGGRGHLTAHLDPGDQHRREVGPGRVDGRGVAGRAGAQNEKSGVDRFAHRVVEVVRSGSGPHGGPRPALTGSSPEIRGHRHTRLRAAKRRNHGGLLGDFQPAGPRCSRLCAARTWSRFARRSRRGSGRPPRAAGNLVELPEALRLGGSPQVDTASVARKDFRLFSPNNYCVRFDISKQD